MWTAVRSPNAPSRFAGVRTNVLHLHAFEENDIPTVNRISPSHMFLVIFDIPSPTWQPPGQNKAEAAEQ
jgi:hypothetical protein